MSVLRTIHRAPILFLAAVVAMVLIWIGFGALDRALARLPSSSWLLRQASGLAEFGAALMRAALTSLVLSPVAIAVHRLVILDDVPKGAAVVMHPRVRLFSAWLFGFLVFAMISEVPALLYGDSSFALKWLMVGIVVVVMLRSAMVFPAIAIDHAGGSIKQRMEEAWRIAAGHLRRLFFTWLVASLPLIIVMFVMARGAAPGTEAADTAAVAATAKPAAILVGGVVAGLVRVGFTAVSAAVVSWLYLWALGHPRQPAND